MDGQANESAPRSEAAVLLLASALREGDLEASRLLAELFREPLVRFCWGYLSSMEEAEDAVQDVCLKVLSATAIPDLLVPWLYRIARNHCLNILRGRARRKETGPMPATSQMHQLLTGHLTRMVRAERDSQLSELVHTLPPEQLEVLRLRYVDDLSRGAIAAILEIPESAVKSRLFEGLKRLRERGAPLDET